MSNQSDEIRVKVVLQAGLRKYGEGVRESMVVLPAGATIGDLIEILRMEEEDVWMIGVNGVLGKRENLLSEGDRVEFYEPVAGG
jgi:molybdopterin converting factor small subunit